MSNNNDTFENLLNQFRSVGEPIQAMRHYLNLIPEEHEHYGLFNILLSRLETEYQDLQTKTLKSIS